MLRGAAGVIAEPGFGTELWSRRESFLPSSQEERGVQLRAEGF